MRALKISMILFCVILLATQTTSIVAAGDRDLGRETLSPNDGWAPFSTGTTGGILAAPDHVYTVHNRREFLAALNDGVYPPPSSPSNKPKIIYIDGTIDANVDDNNQPLTCPDYYRDGYTLEAFLAAYDPAVWGRTAPTGPLEAARLKSRDARQARVRTRVGSNTTIVGVGRTATIRGAWLDLRGTTNVPGSRTNIAIHALGSYVNGRAQSNLVDVVAAYNEVNDPNLGTQVGWAPSLYTQVQPTQSVPDEVGA